MMHSPARVLIAIALLMSLVVAGPASAQQSPTPIDGDDPVEIALAWSALVPDGGSANVLIGTTGAFADSLASGALQGSLGAPLLLTDTNALDPRVAAELDRLQTTSVTILGGDAAISQAVEQDLASRVARVGRAAGATRIETAQALADAAFPDSNPSTVIIARAFGAGSAGFADALAAGAAAARNGFPILLTPTESLDDGLAAYLQANGVTTALIAGGSAAISQATQNQIEALNITTERLSGATRIGTAVAISQRLGDGDQPSTVVQGFGDGAWASGFAAALHAPGGILLTATSSLSGDTIRALYGDGRGEVRCGPTLPESLCVQAGLAASVEAAQPAAIVAIMDALALVPADGTPSSATALVHVAGPGGICVEVRPTALTGPIENAGIAEAPVGQTGPEVVPLGLSQAEDGTSLSCAGLPMDVEFRFFSDPTNFYVQLATGANPDGEIRGQLFYGDQLITAGLSGDQEVPGPGDATAQGFASVWNPGIPGELCYTIDQGSLSPGANAAHIHRGAEGQSGDVVIPLVIDPARRVIDMCIGGLDDATIAEVFANPGGFYVNLHNDPFPMGAIRGNLQETSRT